MSDLSTEKIIELFDAALTSDDTRVKDALQKLLFITALIDATDNIKNGVKGPLTILHQKTQEQSYRIAALEQRIAQLESILRTQIVSGSDCSSNQYSLPSVYMTTGTALADPLSNIEQQFDLFKAIYKTKI